MKSSPVFRALAVVVLLTSSCAAELVSLAITPATFPDASSVSVFVDASLLGDDEVNSPISGELTLELLPSAVNPTTARIVALDAVLDNAVDFNVGGGFLPSVTVEAGAGDLSVNMLEPGPASEIMAGTFEQFENLLGIGGVITTSVEPEPIDLSTQDPTLVDFPEIEIDLDRSSVSLSTGILAEVAVPFEVGFLTVNILVEVDGIVDAVGSVPPANYVWNGSGLYSGEQNWLRGDVADTGSIPTAIDSITFDGSAGSSAVNLGGTTRPATRAQVLGDVRLSDGKLDLEVGLNIAAGATLTVEDDAMLGVTDSPESLSTSGGGTLVVNGEVDANLTVAGATLAGDGKVASLRVDQLGTLQLASDATLEIESQLSFGIASQLQILDASEPGSTTQLATFAEVNVSGLLMDAGSVWLNDTELSDAAVTELGTEFTGHVGDGLFANVLVAANAMDLTTSQAISGDTDGNGEVDFSDFLALSAAFGGAGDWTNGDMDGNGMIDFPDFLILSGSFGTTSPILASAQPLLSGPAAASVPAPAGNVLGLMAVVMALAIRRRSA